MADEQPVEETQEDAFDAGIEVDAQTEPTAPSLIEKLGVSGYDSDEDYLRALDERQRELDEREEQFRKAQPLLADYAQHAADYRTWKQQQEAAAKEPEKPSWSAPMVSETTQRLIDAGVLEMDNGRYRSDQPHLAVHAEEANAFLDHQRAFGRDLVTKPVDALRKAGLDGYLDELLEQRLGKFRDEFEGTLTKRNTEARITGFFKEHAADFWVEGNPDSGLTPKGQAYANAADEYRQLLSGGKDGFEPTPEQQMTIHEMALRRAESLPEPETREAKQERFVETAKRNGKSPRPTELTNDVVRSAALAADQPDESLGDIYDRHIRAVSA